MTDVYSSASRRVSSPTAEGFYIPTPLMNNAFRRTPSPKLAYSERRNSQNMRRSSLEPVLEGETRTLGSRRHSVGNDIAGSQPQPNLAKPRVPISGRPLPRSSGGHRRNSLVRGESWISVEVKTNVVITNEFLFMNELTYHLSIRYGRPITSIVLSLQHGMCLLFGGSFDPAYIMTITALPDQVMATTNRRNVALFQAHLQQALRVPPARGLVQFVPISEECLGYRGETLAAAMGSSTRQGSQNYDTTDPEWRRSRSLTLRKPASMTSMAPKRQEKMEPKFEANQSITEQRDSAEIAAPADRKEVTKKKSFIHSLFMRSTKEIKVI